MVKRLISVCLMLVLLCGVYKYTLRAPDETIGFHIDTADGEDQNGEPAATKDEDENDVLQADVENVEENVAPAAVEDAEDIPNNGILEIKIHNQEEYQRFVSHLEDKTAYDHLWLDLFGTDTTVYLDELLAYQNFEYLRIKNGGTISYKDSRILTYSIRSIDLDHVFAIEEGLFDHIMSGDSYVGADITIEMDNRYSGELPIEELLVYQDCTSIILVWDDDTQGGGLLDVQENMESLKEWDYLQSVQMAKNGCLKGIYRLNDDHYSYTSYEFYNHYEEGSSEICAVFICVKDKESNGEEYFDIIDLTGNKLLDQYVVIRGTLVNRLHASSDLNFDGYNDLVFDSKNNDSRGGDIVFLWDEEKQRFIHCESAPDYYDHIDKGQKRLTRSNTDAWGEDYYIYKYQDGAFVEEHLEIATADMYWKCVTEEYFINGELHARLERVTDEDGFRHYFYEEIGGVRQEVQVEGDLSLHEVSEIFFPEFDFWKYG